jgi:hypothetical protein
LDGDKGDGDTEELMVTTMSVTAANVRRGAVAVANAVAETV